MYKVNNKKAVRNIAFKSFFANKTRNIVAVIAIALTTLMFTSVVTIGLTITDSLQMSYMRQVGTTLHAGYKYMTQDLFERLESDNQVSDIAYRIFIGGVDNAELAQMNVEMSYATENYAKSTFAYPEIGGMPEAKNEVVVADDMLAAMGVAAEIGQEITLEFRANGINYEDTFVVCGIYEYDPVVAALQVITSYEYSADVAPVWVGDDVQHYIEKTLEDNSYTAGTILAEFNFPTAFNIAGQLEDLSERMGLDTSLVNEGVNWAYATSEIDTALVISFTILLLIITCSGYLIIYNIFLISVSNDVKFYGLLKTIGTTAKQLKKNVRMQALMLSVIGIPIGLMAGYLVGAWLVPTIMSNSTLNDFAVSTNPLIFIVAAVFSLTTVQISCNRPCKFIATLSPNEAVRHTNVNQKHKRNRQAKRVTMLWMALANIGRNKLKTTLVVISLSLSALIFSITYTFVNGLDMDEYLSRFVVSDFVVASADILNFGTNRTLDAVTDEFIDEVSALDGVLEVGNTYLLNTTHVLSASAKENVEQAVERYSTENPTYLEDTLASLEENSIYAFIYGVSENIMDKIVTESNDILAEEYLTEEQMELFRTGDYVLTTGYYGVAMPDEIYYGVGETVRIDFGNGNIQEYEVLDAGMLPYALDKRYSTPLDIYFILPENEFLAQLPGRGALNAVISADEQSVPEIEEFMANYTQHVNPLLDYESKALFMAEFEELRNTFLISGFTLSFILGFIGIVNFVNTMITSVSSRKLELAMLQSLGMTTNQMKQTLVYEGLLYGVCVLMFSATAGAAITYHMVNMLSATMVASSYSFNIVPLVIISVILGVISLATPLIIYNNVKSKSIVERLREIG